MTPNSFIDTHCHLDSLKENPLETTLQLAKEKGVQTILTVAVEPSNLQTVVELAQNFAEVYGSQGVHPHEAKLYNSEVREIIKTNLKNFPKLVAVGEIGLDYHYNFSEQSVQRAVFEDQLQLAAELDLPVIIHNRESDEDMMSILNNALPFLKRKGVLHSFSSSKKLWEWAIQNQFFLGFNGIVTFKKSELLRELVSQTPLHQILLETDAPYLAPTPHRGHENAPHFIPLIADKVAELQQIDISTLATKTSQNGQNLFLFSNS